MTFSDIAKMLVQYQNDKEQKQVFETNGYYVDSTFFQIFTYRFVYGNGETALSDPNSLVISKTMSQKYFGNDDPVGKPLLINTPFGKFNYTVKAVFDDSRYKLHIPANYFLSMRYNDMWNWVQRQTHFIGNSLFFTYIKLKQGSNRQLFEKDACRSGDCLRCGADEASDCGGRSERQSARSRFHQSCVACERTIDRCRASGDPGKEMRTAWCELAGEFPRVHGDRLASIRHEPATGEAEDDVSAT